MQASDFSRLSFWHTQLPGPLQPRPALQSDIRSDVAIVGAGYTGLWTAWYLKQMEPALNITVLESEIAGFGASGRNGGWCSAFVSGIDHWYRDPARRDSALGLQRLMFQTVADIGRLAGELSIDCHFEQSGVLEIAVNEAQLGRLRAEYDALRALGFTAEDFRWLEGDSLRGSLGVRGAQAAIYSPHCAAIQPARLVRGLARRLEELGVTIYERTPVTEFASGRVRTDGGQVIADTVLLATEGYGTRLPGNRRRLIPIHSTMVVTEPLDQQLIERLGFDRRYCFGNLDWLITYGQLTADRRIAFGCRGEYYYGSGVRQRFEDGDPVFERVRQTLLRFFPDLGGVRCTHAWGGALGVARSLRPSVQFDSASRIGRAGGYFGNGVAASHLAGQTLADLVIGRDSQRTRTPWVNPPDCGRRWEPEPLRWLGFRAARRLMSLTDRAETRGSRGAPMLQRLFSGLMQ